MPIMLLCMLALLLVCLHLYYFVFHIIFIFFSIPAAWGVYEENGPFELYHIDHCIDPECPWLHDSNSPVINSQIKRRKYFAYNLSGESPTSDKLSSLSSVTCITSCSKEDSNDLALIEFHQNNSNDYAHMRPKSVAAENVSVRRVRKANRMHSAYNASIKSPVRRTDDDDDVNSFIQRLNSSGTVRVTRVKSSVIKSPITADNEPVYQQENSSTTESSNGIRITHVPAVHSAPVEVARPSIIENTIRLDENDELMTSARSFKKNKNKTRVKRVASTHRTSAIESRPSQIDTIKLPPIPIDTPGQTSPASVRVERVRTARKKLQSATATVPFESISKETTNEMTNSPKLDEEFSVVVERIPREKSTRSIK